MIKIFLQKNIFCQKLSKTGFTFAAEIITDTHMKTIAKLTLHSSFHLINQTLGRDDGNKKKQTVA